VLNARRTLNIILVVEASLRVTAIGVSVKDAVVGLVAGEAIGIVIAAFTVVGAVGTELFVASLASKLGKTHIQTNVVPAEVVRTVATHAVGEIHASDALLGTGSTLRSAIVEVAVNWFAPRCAIVQESEVVFEITGKAQACAVASEAVQGT